jgi:hypothetical protein
MLFFWAWKFGLGRASSRGYLDTWHLGPTWLTFGVICMSLMTYESIIYLDTVNFGVADSNGRILIKADLGLDNVNLHLVLLIDTHFAGARISRYPLRLPFFFWPSISAAQLRLK